MSSLSQCQGEPDLSKPIPEIEVTITKEDVGKNILVNIANGDDLGVGQLLFLPDTLQEGWNISIKTVDSPVTTTSNSNDCGDNADEFEAVSHILEIEVTDSNGNPVKHFDRSFQLSIYAVIKDSTQDVCLGYSNNDGQGWKCDRESNINSTGSSSVFLVDTTSDHLTSFAVLLGDGSNRAGCGWGWIEIASLVMIGGAVSLMTLVNTLFCFSSSFRAWVTGRDEVAVMRSLQQKLRRSFVRSPERNPERKKHLQVFENSETGECWSTCMFLDSTEELVPGRENVYVMLV